MDKKTAKKLKKYKKDVVRGIPLTGIIFEFAGNAISSFTEGVTSKGEHIDQDLPVYSEDERVLSLVSTAYTAVSLAIVEIVGSHKQPMLQTRESMLGVSMMFHCGEFHKKRKDQIIWLVIRYLFVRCAIDTDRYSEDVFKCAIKHFDQIKK